MRSAVVVSITLLAWVPAGAGELIFANGSRLSGELSGESLLVSTGSGLVEIAPDDVLTLSQGEINLKDGRVVRGTLVGGQVKARTSLGEIAMKVDDLQAYRASTQATPPVQASTERPAVPASAADGVAPAPAATTAVSPVRSTPAISGGLPTLAAYQEGAPAGLQKAVLSGDPRPSHGRTFEVVGEGVLYRDALFGSSRVGRVLAGEKVTYVDSIDRRLRILNLLVFDGGYWVKVRLADGTEGWVPANTVREVQ